MTKNFLVSLLPRWNTTEALFYASQHLQPNALRILRDLPAPSGNHQTIHRIISTATS